MGMRGVHPGIDVPTNVNSLNDIGYPPALTPANDFRDLKTSAVPSGYTFSGSIIASLFAHQVAEKLI